MTDSAPASIFIPSRRASSLLGLSETDASRRLELAVVAVGGDAKVGADRVAATPPKEVAGPAVTGTPYAPRAESRVTKFKRIP